MKKTRPSIPAFLVAPLLAGVLAATAAAAASSVATTSSPLTGKIWVLVSLGGKAPVKGTELTSAFTAAGRTSGSAGCNRYSGTYRTSGSTIRISRLATTQMACADPVQRQETAFLKALSRTRSYVVSGGKLTLRSATGQGLATFRAQTQTLAGTSWEVVAYNNGKQAVVSVLADTRLTAVFSKSGNLAGFAGCNDYNAGYKATPPKISIGPVAATEKHCEQPAGVGEQETAYLAALETAATYRIEGSRLELRTADGALAVELRRK